MVSGFVDAETAMPIIFRADADWLVNLRDECDTEDRNKLPGIIEKLFLTASGKAMAREIYLSETG
jgi:hypothetical protein